MESQAEVFEIDPDYVDRCLDKLRYTGLVINGELREMEIRSMKLKLHKTIKRLSQSISASSTFLFKAQAIIFKNEEVQGTLYSINASALHSQNGKVYDVVVCNDRILLIRSKWGIFSTLKYVKYIFKLENIVLEQIPVLNGYTGIQIGFRLVHLLPKTNLKIPKKFVFTFKTAIDKARLEIAIRKAVKEHKGKSWKLYT